MLTKRSVLLIDDNTTFLRHVTRFIDRHPELHVVATANSVTTGISEARRLKPDVILLDLSMPERSGLDAIADLRAITSPKVQIIILTMHEAESYREVAFSRGADGFVNKRHLADELIDEIFSEEPGSDANAN